MIYLHIKNHKKTFILLFCLLTVCALLIGCKKNPTDNTTTDNPNGDLLTTEAPEPNQAEDEPVDGNDVTVIDDVSPSVPPSYITVEEAKLLIWDKIDVTKYDLELLNESLKIKNREYYLFLTKENNVVHSPALVVDKSLKKVHCYEADGTLTPFSNFQFYNDDGDADYAWNDSYIHYDVAGNPVAKIELAQGDAHSFSFNLKFINGFYDNELAGFAEISGNTAIYAPTNTEPVLLFANAEHVILVIYSPPSDTPISSIAPFSLLFYAEDMDVTSESIITEEQALDIMRLLTKEQSRLPDEITNYILIPEKMTVTINGEPCYEIGAYLEVTEDRNMLMQSFYVAIDGSKIYTFDFDTARDVPIYYAD